MRDLQQRGGIPARLGTVEHEAVFLSDQDPRKAGWWHLVDFTGQQTECGLSELPDGLRLEWPHTPPDQRCSACNELMPLAAKRFPRPPSGGRDS